MVVKTEDEDTEGFRNQRNWLLVASDRAIKEREDKKLTNSRDSACRTFCCGLYKNWTVLE